LAENFRALQTERHGLIESAYAAKHRVFEDAVLFGHAGQWLFLRDDFAGFGLRTATQ
jgi:hypothetical protein